MSISTGKKLGRPRVDSEEVPVRMRRELLDQLDAWIAVQPDPKLTRPEAVRIALREWLSTKITPAVADATTGIDSRIEAREADVPSLDDDKPPKKTRRRSIPPS